jgi:hypothetical protein
MSRRSVAIGLVLALAAGFATPGVVLAADEWLGTWKLNLSKSKFSPPELAPKSQTITQEAVEGGLKTVIEEVNAQGKPVRTEYTAKLNNQDQPWTSSSEADTIVLQRLDDEYFQTTWKLKGEVMILGSTLISKDRKTMTTTLYGKDTQGRKIGHVTVYDRQ